MRNSFFVYISNGIRKFQRKRGTILQIIRLIQGRMIAIKKSVWITLSLLLVIILVPVIMIYLLNNGNPYTKYLANKYIPSYIEKQGYKESDIKEMSYVEPKYIINYDFYQGHYMVIFKDEPDVTYYYGLNKKEKIVSQFCEKDKELPNGLLDVVAGETKHSEKQCISSYDNRD